MARVLPRPGPALGRAAGGWPQCTLAQSPGLHQNALAGELALGRTLVQYHVRLLVEFGFVEVHRSGSRA